MKVKEINRIEVDEFWADSTIIEAGDFVFVGYCMGNEGKSIEEQIHGVIDVLENRLKMVGLTLESVVKMAVGAMVYVVIEELLPEATRDEKTDICTIGFALGFALMMVLDVAFACQGAIVS